RDHEEQREERGEEPARATHPEGLEIDARRGRPLGQEQRRDEVAGEDEEEIDAEVAAAEVAVVKQEHADDREATQAVEGREVGDADATRRSGHGRRRDVSSSSARPTQETQGRASPATMRDART